MSAQAALPPQLPALLPPLRDDLQLHPAAPHSDGSPAWVIQDPVSNNFYRIGWLEFELLARWALGDPNAILSATSRETLLTPSEEELGALYGFLMQSQLLRIHDPRHTEELIARSRKSRTGYARWLLHHYLFFRIPILHPATALRAMLPWLEWVFSRGAFAAVLALSTLGVVLTARQWDVFLASFLDTLSPGGLASYLIALAVTKSLHELGHALTATRYGLRVAHMGVAFVVMWPMLYTDTGESWRLADSRQRLRIASAGIVTELAVAGLATLGWNLCAEGDLKQALFFLASTAWLISLGLNASPFMRFDGYFILSDVLDMPNLHERSFAVARVAVRKLLLGWSEPDPEPLTPWKRRALTAFALGVWLYRLVVFVGIAVAVYFYFFKALGIFLFAVEITWFVVLPMWRELRIWFERSSEIRFNRRVSALLALVCLFVLAAIPWSNQVRGAGYAHPAQVFTFYSPGPARLLSPPLRGTVKAGQEIFALEQPEFAFRGRLAEVSVEALTHQLRGLSGLNDGEDFRAGLEHQRALHAAEIRAQKDESARLALIAPFDGVMTDIDPDLASGVWVGSRNPLATLVDPRHWQVEILVGQNHIARVDRDATVRFYAEGRKLAPIQGKVIDIETTRTTRLPAALLSSRHGGTVPVLQNADGMTPRDALYRIRVELEQPPGHLKVLRGEAVIEGRRESWLLNLFKPIAIVVIRELGF